MFNTVTVKITTNFVVDSSPIRQCPRTSKVVQRSVSASNFRVRQQPQSKALLQSLRSLKSLGSFLHLVVTKHIEISSNTKVSVQESVPSTLKVVDCYPIETRRNTEQCRKPVMVATSVSSFKPNLGRRQKPSRQTI